MESFRGKVAVIGTGCCKFGENWDKSLEDMILDATAEAFQEACIEIKDIQGAWFGVTETALSGATLSNILKLPASVPVTRVQNYCPTGMDAFRNACLAVISGEYEIALVVGAEKLKDSGIRGRPGVAFNVFGTGENFTAPGLFALAATRYLYVYGATKETLAKIAVKNHYNGSLCPKAHLQRKITLKQAMEAPIIAWPLGLFDCTTAIDGAAAAIVCSPQVAQGLKRSWVDVLAIGMAVTPPPLWTPGFDFLGWIPTRLAAKQAYQQAGITKPFEEIDCAEVHDCFTINELLTYEDLGFCERGQGKHYVDEGTFELGGELPVNMDGGLKSFGHPTGATGVRMVHEIYRQLQGKVEEARQVKNANVGLAHNFGGPVSVGTVAILSKH